MSASLSIWLPISGEATSSEVASLIADTAEQFGRSWDGNPPAVVNHEKFGLALEFTCKEAAA